MLTLENIGKRYGERFIFRHITLRAAPGTLTLIAGPNGAGKSTLLRVMAELARPDEGTVTLTCPPGTTGYLGHDTFVYPHLTALENLAFWQRLYKKPADETTLLDTLDGMGLLALADEQAGTFSKGTAQRLSLARIFLQEPSLLLLDEPLSGLDTASSARVRGGLRRCMEQGIALVWVSHEPLRELDNASAALLLFGDGSHTLFVPDAFADFARLLAASDGGGPC